MYYTLPHILNLCNDLYLNSQNALSALMFAAAKGYTDITRVLVQHGADPNAQNTVRIYSPFIYAPKM